MGKYYVCTLALLLFTATGGFGQKTVYHMVKDGNFEKALDYFNKGNYASARELFSGIAGDLDYQTGTLADITPEMKARAHYYTALSAMRLFHNDAEFLTLRFVNKFPEHGLVNDAQFQLANYFYANRKHNQALSYYQQVDRRLLTQAEQAELYFKRGYCFFLREDFEPARVDFYEIKDKDTRYTAPAVYYYSHIHYTEQNYQTALNGFLRLTGDETFGAIVPYYITHIYFFQKEYQKVIDFAPPLLESVSDKRVAEMARIVGEAYLQTGLFNEAIEYLEQFAEKADFVTAGDKYQIAYAYYRAGRFDEAAGMFARLSGTGSKLGQNAHYHLGDCYLKLNRKLDARMAFQSASRLDFDEAIKEDAHFNYAVLTYELSYTPFNEAIVALNQYISAYPGSKRTDEAYNYLVAAYMNTRNYSMALASLEKINNKGPEMRKAYHRIAYFRGLELFNNLSYAEAIDMFDQSLKFGNTDNNLKVLAGYWKAEAFYRLADYSRAITVYETFIGEAGAFRLDEYGLAHYGLGYASFQLKQYDQAASWFRKYVGVAVNQQTKTVGDALNRIGDSYFMRKDYHAAIDFYDRSIANGSSDMDYALYQKGLSLGVLGREEEKIVTLKRLVTSFPASAYGANALYESGESLVALNRNEEAMELFKQISDKHQGSSLGPKALVSLGLMHYNANRLQEAMQVYKTVIRDYPQTEEAKGALKGLKNVYIDLSNVDGYVAFVKSLGTGVVQISVKEQDSLSYISAENIYMSGNCQQAVKSMGRYIENFSDGGFILNAHFYKGDCHYQLKQHDEAMRSFEFIINSPVSMFTEQSLLGAARIAFNLQDYQKSLDYYTRLEDLSESRGNRLEAAIGRMRSLYMLNRHDQSVDAARKVLEYDKVPEAAMREARFKLAKSLLALERLALALDEFAIVAMEVNSPEGAEAKYRVAWIYFMRGDLKQADKTIGEFAGMTTPHQYWMAKGFILWADIFAAQQNYFQAIQTVQSLIDYYEVSGDGILEEARQKYKEYSARQQDDEKVVEPTDIEINVP